MPAHKGELHHSTRMTEEKVREARRLWASGDYTISNLARKYEISHQSMTAILRGETWRHV